MAFATVDGYSALWRRSRNRGALTIQVRQPGTSFESTHGLLCESEMTTCENWCEADIRRFATQRASAMLEKLRSFIASNSATHLPMWFA